MNAITEFSGEYRWLSNFWPVKITRNDGITYPSAEHAYVAAKVLDLPTRRALAAIGTAGQVKRAGRALDLRGDWDRVKEIEMLSILRLKFSNQGLAERLRATGSIELIEGNTWGDTYWGVCRGIGRNVLGKLLMQVRSEINQCPSIL